VFTGLNIYAKIQTLNKGVLLNMNDLFIIMRILLFFLSLMGYACFLQKQYESIMVLASASVRH